LRPWKYENKDEMLQYSALLVSVKQRIRKAQIKATLSANAEMILMYWDIGNLIHMRQKEAGWGSGVIPQLSKDIRNELPEVKGFSERNLKRMIRFYREYPALSTIVPQPVAQLQEKNGFIKSDELYSNNVNRTTSSLVIQMPWGHNLLLIEKVKQISTRIWYMKQAIKNGWSRDTLSIMIKNNTFDRQGTAITNFGERLPPTQSEFAKELLKDPYIFDFMTLEEPFHQRELESGLVQHLEKFLLELGQGFAFVGRQYHLTVSDKDFYLDLLFYHYRLHCFVVVELKRGEFKPEYAGKMNFYCSVHGHIFLGIKTLHQMEDWIFLALNIFQIKNFSL